MKTLAITCAWLCLAFTQASDQSSYNAYLGATDVLWDQAVAEKQLQYDKEPKDQNARWNLALTQYGLMSATMRNRNEERFDKYYKVTEGHLEALVKDDKFKGDAKALLSGLYGLKLSYSSMMGMVLGPKSSGLIEDALKIAPQSAIVWKLQGNSKMFTPSMFGGDTGEAVRAYEKSIELFEKQPEALQYNWLYLDTMIFLGQAYSSQGQWTKAVATYEKALKFEPNANWVKQELLPKAKQKAQGN